MIRQRLIVAMLGAALLRVLAAQRWHRQRRRSPSRRTVPVTSTYFLFEYNDSTTVGIDSGCADKNDVTRSQTCPG